MTRILIALAAVLAIVATACAAPQTGVTGARISSTGAAAISPAHEARADRSVTVLMTEFAFDMESYAVTPGETVEFVVTNAGVVQHEFRLSNRARIDEHLESGHGDHDDDDAAPGEAPAVTDPVLLLEPGETASIVVAFPEDTSRFTEVACLLPGHYEAGMSASLELST